MQNTRNEESFMPNGKVGSPEWIEQFLHYSRAHPGTETEQMLFQAMNTDSLTQVLNRGGIDHIIENLEKTQTPTGVLFFDLMGFKEVNDIQGHAAGDEVLTYTANTLSELFRTSADRRLNQDPTEFKDRRSSSDRRAYALNEDIIFRKLTQDSNLGRYGGDEFMVLLPRVQTYKALENIGFRVVGAMNEDSNCQPSSIGGSLYVPGVSNMEETISQADQAMYKVKKELKKDQATRNLAQSESGLGIHLDDTIETYLPAEIRKKLAA